MEIGNDVTNGKDARRQREVWTLLPANQLLQYFYKFEKKYVIKNLYYYIRSKKGEWFMCTGNT
jgi:hypothetical protein